MIPALLLNELPLVKHTLSTFDLLSDLSFVYIDFLLEVKLTPIDLLLFFLYRVLMGQAVSLCSSMFGYIVLRILLSKSKLVRYETFGFM